MTMQSKKYHPKLSTLMSLCEIIYIKFLLLTKKVNLCIKKEQDY
jgi:uncharacterized protein YqiB (DUF1249 family)